jgi:vacuolar-type H+-ATPase subunit I/STV1
MVGCDVARLRVQKTTPLDQHGRRLAHRPSSIKLLSWLYCMTPEERFEHIEQAIVQIVDIQREQADVQRAQARIQRDQAQAILEVTEKLDALIDVVDKLVKRNGH